MLVEISAWIRLRKPQRHLSDPSNFTLGFAAFHKEEHHFHIKEQLTNYGCSNLTAWQT